MVHVSIIGCGQLGSRHLQACALLKEFQISLVDPSKESLAVAEKRFREVYDGGEVRLKKFRSVSEIDQSVDIAIIATGADVRADIIEELLKHTTVGAFILEKVLFQNVKDYTRVEHLLAASNTKAWVNCHFRSLSFLKDLKQTIDVHQPVDFKVYGNLWSLSSSAVHFLDLFQFFTDQESLKCTSVDLSSALVDAKRPGYKEFYGSMKWETLNGNNQLELESLQAEPLCLKMDLNHQQKEHRLVFSGDQVLYEDQADQTSRQTFVMLPQSRRTHIIIQQILEEQHVDLPSYAQAKQTHLFFLECLKKHVPQIFNDEGVCLIT